jgi:O-acetyl-ADP-ribose deacetylase (regulator of RNase III)
MQSHLLDDTVIEEALSAVRRAIADEEAGGPALAPAAATLRQSSARAEAQTGNAVAAENYYQHAEHYFRTMYSGSSEG